MRLSVLLPVFNAAATLPACLASIRRQTLENWECVIVDDGSTDGSRAVAEAAVRQDPRFRLVVQPHAGIVTALNTGLALCRAPIIARMDADDVIRRERLARQVAALDADPSLAAVGCHVRLGPRETVSARLAEYEAWLNGITTPEAVARDAFVECPVAHPTLVMRREMAGSGYRDCGWPEDYDLILRALGRGLRIGVVAERLHFWRVRPESLSRTDARYAIERFTACKAHHLSRGFLADRSEYVLWGYGRTGRMLHAALARLGHRPAAIVEVHPGRIGQRIHGAPVIPPDRLPEVAQDRRVVASVARPGPRADVRAALDAMGFVEGRHYVCAA